MNQQEFERFTKADPTTLTDDELTEFAMQADFNAKNARRRAAKLDQTPEWCKPGTEAYKEIQATYVTAEALSDATGLEFHVDHIVSLSNGGQHRPDNLRPLRADQNISKGSRTDWLPPEPVFRRRTNLR